MRICLYVIFGLGALSTVVSTKNSMIMPEGADPSVLFVLGMQANLALLICTLAAGALLIGNAIKEAAGKAPANDRQP